MFETKGVAVTAFSVPKPGKSQANWEELFTLPRRQENEKRQRLELVKKQCHSQEPAFEIFGRFCDLAMFTCLPQFRRDYKVISSLTRCPMETEWPFLMPTFCEIVDVQ